jgi:hypothetical protein
MENIIKQQYITIWPPTISESHTEQLASYRWPQNKSNAIKEKIMLSIRIPNYLNEDT